MTRYIFLLLFSGLLCVPASAQPDGVTGLWKHYFIQQKRTVYLDLSARAVIVWSVADNGQCSRYPGASEWQGDRLRRYGAADWQVRLEEPDLHVTFPDTTVTYRRSSADPRDLCQREDI